MTNHHHPGLTCAEAAELIEHYRGGAAPASRTVADIVDANLADLMAPRPEDNATRRHHRHYTDLVELLETDDPSELGALLVLILLGTILGTVLGAAAAVALGAHPLAGLILGAMAGAAAGIAGMLWAVTR